MYGEILVKAKESQNQIQFDSYKEDQVKLGPYTTHIWKSDPRHLLFLLSRYKFVAKMLEGKEKILEVGCGDAFGLPVVAQTTSHVHGLDWEPLLMEDNKDRLNNIDCSFSCIDITKEKTDVTYDAAFSLDVIEHIPADIENKYYENIAGSLHDDGVFIIGTPNVTSDAYASEASKKGHINLKSHDQLREDMQKYFKNVFMFSMNDEIVHTGFGPMAHYLFAVGVGVR